MPSLRDGAEKGQRSGARRPRRSGRGEQGRPTQNGLQVCKLAGGHPQGLQSGRDRGHRSPPPSVLLPSLLDGCHTRRGRLQLLQNTSPRVETPLRPLPPLLPQKVLLPAEREEEAESPPPSAEPGEADQVPYLTYYPSLFCGLYFIIMYLARVVSLSFKICLGLALHRHILLTNFFTGGTTVTALVKGEL